MAITYAGYFDIYDIREEVAKATGRFDLIEIVDSVYCNNGIDRFIHQGQRALERRLNVHPTVAKWFTDLTAGQYVCSIPNLRAVQEVWVLTSTTRKKLIKYDHRYFLEEETTKAFDSADRAEPVYYYPTGLRLEPNTLESVLAPGFEYEDEHRDTNVLNDPKLKGVIVWPPCDQKYTIEVGGLYYDEFPSGPCGEGEGEGEGELGLNNPTATPEVLGPVAAYNTYSNYWMQEYPNLLIMAAIQQIEYLYKGSKSAKRWDDIIGAELIDIEKDAIEEEVANVTKMLG